MSTQDANTQSLTLVQAVRDGLYGEMERDEDVVVMGEDVGKNGGVFRATQGLHEEFGDGIMSAIDFSMDIQRQSDPKGDRVNVVLSGKFLPYKSY